MKLIYGPDPIFTKTCEPVTDIGVEELALCDQLREVLYHENAVGVAAPMIGILKQIIAIDLQEGGINNLIIMINPCVKEQSEEKQSFVEASICFPGISAEIERPRSITIEYLDKEGLKLTMRADGFLATVIQHEMDYLKGVTFLDYLSPMKRKILLKKMKKYKQSNQL